MPQEELSLIIGALAIGAIAFSFTRRAEAREPIVEETPSPQVEAIFEAR